MKDSDRKLLKEAFLEAMEEKQAEELACCTEEIRPSEQHLRKVSRILGVRVGSEKRRRYPAKRVIAWGLAAVLLMISALTAYAYSGTSFGFVERSHGLYIEVGHAYSFDIVSIDDIEEPYELGYLPFGYGRTRLYSHRQRTEITYRDMQGNEIEFQQHPLGRKETWGFRNELGKREIKKYGEIYVYCYDTEDSRTFLWRDDKYAMVLYVSTDMKDSEILKIISGVRMQEDQKQAQKGEAG